MDAGQRAYRIARMTSTARWKARGAGLLVEAAKEQDSRHSLAEKSQYIIVGPDEATLDEAINLSDDLIDADDSRSSRLGAHAVFHCSTRDGHGGVACVLADVYGAVGGVLAMTGRDRIRHAAPLIPNKRLKA
jgi:hypothetical protein